MKNASKTGARALNYSIKQEKGGKLDGRPGERGRVRLEGGEE